MSKSLFWNSDSSSVSSFSFRKKQKYANRFILRDKIGRGGNGQVWRARDTWLSQNIALKISSRDLKKETLMLRRLPKESYVSVFDYVKDKNSSTTAYSMELLLSPWVTLSNYRDSYLSNLYSHHVTSLFATRLVILIAIDLLHALKALHGKKYGKSDRWCHGDIKPANIYVDKPCLNRVSKQLWGTNTLHFLKIGDLGLVKEAGQHLFGGTPMFMAPEQHGFNVVRSSTDIYCTGQTIATLITGRPFLDDELKHISRMRELINDNISNTYLSEKITEILRRMTFSNQAQRPDIDQVIQNFRKLINSEEEWKILRELLKPENSDGVTISEAGELLFDTFASIKNWRNRTKDRVDIIKNSVRNMYRRGLLHLNGHKYYAKF